MDSQSGEIIFADTSGLRVVDCKIADLEWTVRHWNKQGYKWTASELRRGGYRLTFKEALAAALESIQ